MIGAVIPTRGESDLLQEAVASVSEVPVLVVDDSPNGGVVVEHATVVRSGGMAGFAGAANFGLRTMQERGVKRVLLLNDDAVLAPGSLQALNDAWSDDVGALSPVIHEPDGPVYGIVVGSWGRVRLAQKPREVQALSGACLMIRSTERFDPAYVHGFEDIELCAWLQQRGLRIACIASAQCEHRAGATVSRRSRWAQRHAVSGHLRFVCGGHRGIAVVGLALLQIIREGGPVERILGVWDGVRDHLRVPPPRSPHSPIDGPP